MKSVKFTKIVTVLAVSCFTLPLAAQNTYPAVPNNHATTPSTDQKSPMPSASLDTANDIIGLSVKDPSDHNAGTVKDLAVDLQNGRIAEVIINTGGALSTEALTAVPPACFTYDASAKLLRVNTGWTELKNAPSFAMAHWKDATGSSSVMDNYKRYGVACPGFGYLERATALMRDSVRSEQNNKRLGSVKTLVMDLPAGSISDVILESGGFLGIDAKFSALPPQQFRFDPDRDTLTLNQTPDDIQNAPHFKFNDWRTAVTALANPQGSRDTEVTTTIKEKIQTANGLSDMAKNVQVDTQEGRVTLRGTVNTDSEKQQIADIAASVVQAGNVDNQIMVSTSSLSSASGPH